MTYVYVLSRSGRPLMPTARCGHVRILLKEKKARVVCGRPFTVQLLYDTDEAEPYLYGGTDPGRTNIGNAVVTEDGECVYRDKVETRNDEVAKGMSDRKKNRQARRRGERLVRKRRAKRCGTLSTKLGSGRLIPGTKKPTLVKDIINQEARFRNRKKRQLITPSVKQLVDTHLNHVDQIRKILPVKGWCLEANRFAFMKLEDGSVRGIDFQNGRLKGYASVDDFVYERQKGKCFCCGAPIEHYHHVKEQNDNGFDGPENKVGLCNSCHTKIHIGELELDVEGFGKKYQALSVLNQAIPYIYLGLVERFDEENVFICAGYDTKEIREAAGLDKDHDIDALCIASMATGVIPKQPEEQAFSVKQYRRHDRAKINNQPERTYKLDGKTVARNRKPRIDQKGFALSEWYEKQVSLRGRIEADRMLSRLKVRKSYRRYNNLYRVMPGAIVRHDGRIEVMERQQNNGYYFNLRCGRIKASECEILHHNAGLVYI